MQLKQKTIIVRDNFIKQVKERTQGSEGDGGGSGKEEKILHGRSEVKSQ